MSTAKRILESTDPIYAPEKPAKFNSQDVDSEMEFEARYKRDMENGVEFPVQSENVAAQAIEGAYPETVFFSFDKPAPPQKVEVLRQIIKRFETNLGQPLVVFDSDPENPNEGWVALHIPTCGIRKVHANPLSESAS